MVRVFDVIWLYDDGAEGQRKPRMMVCLSPDDGFFFRINTSPKFLPNVAIMRNPHHAWLVHDSFVQCSLLEYDEYPVQETLESRGVIGQVHFSMVSPIVERLRAAHFRQGDKLKITKLLRELERSER